MPALRIRLDGDGCWPDLAAVTPPVADDLEVALLAGGMTSGRPSVTLRLNLPDGSVVLAQTSLALFLTAADTMKAAAGDPRASM